MSIDDEKKSSLFRVLTSLKDSGSLAGFLESAFDAAVVFDSQERIIYWNRAAVQMFGWTAQEAMGKTSAELFWPESPQERKRSRARLASLKRGATLRGENHPCRKDGSSLWVQYTAQAIFDANGRITGYLTLYRDISIQMRLHEKEEQLKQSNQRLHEILGSIQDDFYVLNRDWVFVFASKQFTSRIGKEPENFVGNNIWEMFPKHVGSVLEENFRAAMEKREIRRFETRGQYTNAWYGMAVFPSADGITVLGTDITERKQAEQALLESRRKYQDLIETTSDFIWEMDPQGRYTYCSPQMEKLWGINPEDMIGKTPFDVMPPEEKERASEFFRDVAYSATSFRGLTTSAFNSQGDPIFIETSGVPFFDQDGELLGFRGVTRDITERKRAEEALRASEFRYRTVADNTYDFECWIRQDGQYLYASASCERIYGRKAEEFLADPGLRRRIVFPADQMAFDRHLAQEAMRVPGETEFRIVRPDGSTCWISHTCQPVFDESGHYLGVRASNRDITERKHAEEQLRELSQRLTYHVDNSPLAVIEWGPDMRLVRWSGAAEHIFGWKAEEVLGKRIEDLRWVYEEDLLQVNDVSADLQTGIDPHRFSANRNYRKDGSLAYCEWYNSSFLDESGNLRSILSLVLDVTDRIRAEEALRENEKQLQSLNETLEQKVRDKTVQVRRLASDLVKAEQRERTRISHILHDDLQQRIYALQIELTVLRDHLPPVNDVTRQDVSDIERQMDEIRQVIRHLSIELSPPILPDEGLAHALHWLATHMQQQHGLPITLEAESSFVIADEQIHVLLFNCVRELLFNVVKHAQASRAVVALRWSNEGLRIEVRDDGKGFTLRQENSETNGAGKLPSSFGLPTIRHQLSLFGGSMAITSEPGAGTQIILIVPVAEVGKEAQPIAV